MPYWLFQLALKIRAQSPRLPYREATVFTVLNMVRHNSGHKNCKNSPLSSIDSVYLPWSPVVRSQCDIDTMSMKCTERGLHC